MRTPDYPEETVFPGGQPDAATAPQAISEREAAAVAAEVHALVKAGDEDSAWERLQHLHPADIASIVAGLPGRSRDALVRVMSPETLAWALRQMNPVEAARVSGRMGARVLTTVVSQLHPSNAFDTVEHLSRLPMRGSRTLVRRLVPLLRWGRAAAPQAEPLPDTAFLDNAPGTAGALMTPIVPAVSVDDTAQAASAWLIGAGAFSEKVTHVYLTDDTGALAGQVSITSLAMVDWGAPLRDHLTGVVAQVAPETPTAECVRLHRHYNLTQIPVVEDGRLTGVILHETLLGAAVEQDTRSMQRVANVAGETVGGPLTGAIRTRLPWLTINLGTTFLAAATIALFESTLARAVALAAFLPVVAGQGGIGGTQTLTLIVRGIALGELVGISARRLLMREALLGIVHGLWLGVLVAAIAWIWQGNAGLSLVLGIAMLGNMLIAGFSGAAVPLFLRRIGVDPAVASAVVVTTATDVFGFLLFLGVATAAISIIV